MSSTNIGWLFYKDYFKGLDYANLEKDSNKTLIGDKVKNIISQSVTITDGEMLGNTHLKATTTYPGLLLGSGNAHELPGIEGQAILGFHFDYTSGLPVIQGSSVKGVLRSAFNHPEYIQELLKEKSISFELAEVNKLETEIFGQKNGSNKVIAGKDIFFDASVISDGKILGDDYLTPHDEEGLKNPIPLRFIKVLSGISFRFDFNLKQGILSKSEKTDLFMSILADLGLGAKTNVGYGKFENFSKIQTAEEQEVEKEEREKKSFDDAVENNSSEDLEAFKRNFPKSLYDVDTAIAKLKEQDKAKHVNAAFDNLVKTNKKHVESFIKKYENDPLASDYVARASALFSEKTTKPTDGNISDLLNAKDAKKFKIVLDNIDDISEEDKKIIEQNIVRICTKLNGKKQDKFFKEIQLERFIDQDFQDKMKALVGAK